MQVRKKRAIGIEEKYISSGKRSQQVPRRLHAQRPLRHLGVQAQAVRSGKAQVLALLDQRDDLAAIDRRVLLELELQRFVRGIDARDAQRRGEQAQHVGIEQHLGGIRQQAEAVDELLAHGVQVLLRAAIGKPLVERQALVHVAAVELGQQRRDVQLDLRGRLQRLVEVDGLALP